MKINKITEQINIESKDIDQKDISEILRIINNDDAKVSKAVKKSIPEISNFINKVVEKMTNSGRLIYIGSGTSGRLGVLDASECPPTFGVSKGLVVGIIAGGNKALKESVEGAEDSSLESLSRLKKIKLNPNDVLLGISASGTTPFVLSALEYAASIGVSTGLLTCNKLSAIKYVDYLIRIIVGPEILTGSTRLKAGSATKMALNMISTVSMMKLNHTFGNVMVGLLPKNNKLINRAISIIMSQASVNEEEAKRLYNLSKQNLKIAILVGIKNISPDKAKMILKKNKYNLNNSLK